MTVSVEKIQKLEEQIKAGEIVKIKAEASLNSLRKEYADCENKLKTLGIKDVKKAEEEVLAMEKDLETKLKALEDTIPVDIIEKYKNYDFNNDVEPNENLGF